MKIIHPRAGDKERTAIVERENKEVRRHLNNLMNELFMKDRWSFAIKIVQRILNNTEHTTTGYSPAKLMFGRNINSPQTTWQDKDNLKSSTDYSKWIKDKIDLQGKIISFMQEKMIYKDKINVKKRTVSEHEILLSQEFVLYRNLDKNKQQLKYIGPYQVTNRDGDFYELTSLTQERKPFYAHARHLKRYHSQEGVDPIQIALMDRNEYLLDKISEFKCVTGGKPKDKNDYVFSVTYTGYPDEKHWLTYNELQNESIFVEWCYGGYHPFTIGWITQRAKDINLDLIAKLNIIQATKAAKEKISRDQLKADKLKTIINQEEPMSQTPTRAKTDRKKRIKE